MSKGPGSRDSGRLGEWNILIVGENHTCIHVHVTALHVFFCFLTISYFIFQFDTGVIWYFEPHGKLNPGSIYLWHFDPRFNFPYGILTPGSIFCHCILNPLMVNWTTLISTKREEFIPEALGIFRNYRHSFERQFWTNHTIFIRPKKLDFES